VPNDVVKVDFHELLAHCGGKLAEAGLPPEAAEEAARALLDADLRGLRSHGVAMLPIYLERLRRGAISPRTSAEVVSDAGALVILDAGHALAQLTSGQAVALLAERARRGGIAAVGVRRGHHFGAASTWSIRLAEAGLVGIAMSNSAPLMAAPGGSRAVVGNNPLSIAVMDDLGQLVVADLASSAGSLGKIRAAQRSGASIPPDWAFDSAGRPTLDPGEALHGTLAPAGGPKGFALALLIEVLTGVLTGGPFGGEVARFSVDLDRPNNCAHLFIAIDPSAVGLGATVAEGVRALAADIQDDTAANGSTPRPPGQWRLELAAEQRRSGVDVERRTLEQLEFQEATHGIRNRITLAEGNHVRQH